jgi:hypothetical protein
MDGILTSPRVNRALRILPPWRPGLSETGRLLARQREAASAVCPTPRLALLSVVPAESFTQVPSDFVD